MRTVFADTLYWVALLDLRDPWHQAAIRISRGLGMVRIVTTDAVVVEAMNALCEAGPAMRQWVVRSVHDLMARSDVEVVEQDRARLLGAIEFFDSRRDKDYRLTDCFSMLVMHERALTDVLTNDHHFEQEGFCVLIRQP